MANEGRMLVICPQADADRALAVLQRQHRDACRIGSVQAALAETSEIDRRHPVNLRSSLGVLRPLDLQRGEQLPRIC
jgi:hydrogenase expression/formation protein HypE